MLTLNEVNSTQLKQHLLTTNSTSTVVSSPRLRNQTFVCDINCRLLYWLHHAVVSLVMHAPVTGTRLYSPVDREVAECYKT
jgi:hypothetical protein